MTPSEFATVLSVLVVVAGTAGFVMTLNTALGDWLERRNSQS
jgi:hypothetical protein